MLQHLVLIGGSTSVKIHAFLYCLSGKEIQCINQLVPTSFFYEKIQGFFIIYVCVTKEKRTV